MVCLISSNYLLVNFLQYLVFIIPIYSQQCKSFNFFKYVISKFKILCSSSCLRCAQLHVLFFVHLSSRLFHTFVYPCFETKFLHHCLSKAAIFLSIRIRLNIGMILCYSAGFVSIKILHYFTQG